MTPKERNDAPQWVAYELETLYHQSTLLYHAKKQMAIGEEIDLWRTIHTAALESFLIHFRCMKDFLNNLKFPDDVKAGDYASSWSGSANVRETTNEKARLDKLLAHLSYTRDGLDRGQWEVRQMEQNITAAMETFLKQVNTADEPLFVRINELVQKRKAVYAAWNTGVTATVSSGLASNSTASVRTYEGWWTLYDRTRE
jgi:hypothetical protein